MATELRSFAPATAGFLEIRLGALSAAVQRRVLAWDERSRLAGLSDATLRDIGCSRGDMDAEARRLP